MLLLGKLELLFLFCASCSLWTNKWYCFFLNNCGGQMGSCRV